MTSSSSRVDPSLVIAVLGLAVSAYLTVEHFTAETSLACPEGVVVNCTKVTTSQWATLFGVPVALLGLGYFVVMTLLVSPPAWRQARLDPVRIAGAGTGVLMVLYLVYIELFAVNAICLWCTAVHVLTLGLFGAILWRVSDRSSRSLVRS